MIPIQRHSGEAPRYRDHAAVPWTVLRYLDQVSQATGVLMGAHRIDMSQAQALLIVEARRRGLCVTALSRSLAADPPSARYVARAPCSRCGAHLHLCPDQGTQYAVTVGCVCGYRRLISP